MLLAYDRKFWEKYHIKKGIRIDPLLCPSWLISGSSGSGKSYAVKWLIKQLLMEHRVDFWFLNYKDSIDFRFLKTAGYSKYYSGKDCAKGFEAFYQRFCDIRENEGEEIPYMTVLFFDEYPAFLLYTQTEDKKKADRYIRMLSEMLMLFRSYKGGCTVICQQSRSEYFGGGRDNFHARILLTRGRPSKENAGMNGFSKEDFEGYTYDVGEGVCYIDGSGQFQIKYPEYDSKKLEADILALLDHAPDTKP